MQNIERQIRERGDERSEHDPKCCGSRQSNLDKQSQPSSSSNPDAFAQEIRKDCGRVVKAHLLEKDAGRKGDGSKGVI